MGERLGATRGGAQMVGWHSGLWQEASTPSSGSSSVPVNTTGSDLVDQAGFDSCFGVSSGIGSDVEGLMMVIG